MPAPHYWPERFTRQEKNLSSLIHISFRVHLNERYCSHFNVGLMLNHNANPGLGEVLLSYGGLEAVSYESTRFSPLGKLVRWIMIMCSCFVVEVVRCRSFSMVEGIQPRSAAKDQEGWRLTEHGHGCCRTSRQQQGLWYITSSKHVAEVGNRVCCQRFEGRSEA